MDRHKIKGNRHKKKEVFKSGCKKRQLAKEKEKKNEEVTAKSRRLTDYMKFKTDISASFSEKNGDDALPSASPGRSQNFEGDEMVSSIKIIIKIINCYNFIKDFNLSINDIYFL